LKTAAQASLLLALLSVLGVSAKPIDSLSTNEFWIVREAEFRGQGNPLVMECPAHAHGTPDEAMSKLRSILASRGQNRISSIWVCRYNQMQTLEKFAPLVNQVCINPFVYASSDAQIASNSLIWSHCNQPLLNEVREIRDKSAGRHLLACIDLLGEPAIFGKRNAAIEELQWMAFAAVGANFQGIIWRGEPASDQISSDIERLAARLEPYTKELGAAQPVGYVRETQQRPLSALRSSKTLFIVLLDPQYMTIGKDGIVQFPLGPVVRDHGEVEVALPSGASVLSGHKLSGATLHVNSAGALVKVPYEFCGGGEILVLDIQERQG
jgi:hypothetical protein